MRGALAIRTASTNISSSQSVIHVIIRPMEQQILEIDAPEWKFTTVNDAWINALEAGKVLYFPRLAFTLTAQE